MKKQIYSIKVKMSPKAKTWYKIKCAKLSLENGRIVTEKEYMGEILEKAAKDS